MPYYEYKKTAKERGVNWRDLNHLIIGGVDLGIRHCGLAVAKQLGSATPLPLDMKEVKWQAKPKLSPSSLRGAVPWLHGEMFQYFSKWGVNVVVYELPSGSRSRSQVISLTASQTITQIVGDTLPESICPAETVGVMDIKRMAGRGIPGEKVSKKDVELAVTDRMYTGNGILGVPNVSDHCWDAMGAIYAWQLMRHAPP